MHGLILAGGEGSRLKRDGVPVPKALVPVGGKPQVLHLLDTLAGLGCQSLTVAVRSDFPEVLDALQGLAFPVPFSVIPCRTPTSLHTLAEGLAQVPPGPVFCTMVDTVMRPSDWRVVYIEAARLLAGGVETVLAVTPYVDDESPVYVTRAPGGRVQTLGERPGDPPCVTGGVYAFAPAARRAAADAVRQGQQKMRGFLHSLVAGGAAVASVEVPRIIDIDRASDLQLANAWLASPDTEQPERAGPSS